MIKLQAPNGEAAEAADPVQLANIRAGLGLGNVNNTADAEKPLSGPQAAALAGRVAVEDLGGAAAVEQLRDLIAGHQAFASGYRTLIAGASTFARCSVMVGANEASYQRQAGVVTLELNLSTVEHTPSIGDLIYVVSNHRRDVGKQAQLASVQSLGGNLWRVTYADARGNLNAGQLTEVSVVFPSMGSNTHSWPTMVNLELDGVLDFVNVSSGGALLAGFNHDDREAEIEAMGPFDFGLFNFGYGNDILGAANTAGIAAAILQALGRYARLVRRGFFISNLGSGSTLIGPDTAKWTTNARLHEFLRREIPRRFPNVEFVDVEAQAMALATYGPADTADMLAGRPPANLFDSSGIHYTPLSSAFVARVVADYLRPHVRADRASFLRPCRADNAIVNSAADVNGGRNPNGIGGWYGAVATAPVTIAGIGAIGVAPVGTTMAAQNLAAGMSAAVSLEPNPRGGFSTLLQFNDEVGSSSGPAVQWRYDGGATPFLSFVNDPLNQAAWCDFWVEFSIAGFYAEKLRAISVALVAESAAGAHVLCAPMVDMGLNGMWATSSTWQQGLGGVLRAPSKFPIPARTFTAAYLLIDFRGFGAAGGGGPLGAVEVRLGHMRLARRENIA